MEEEETIPFHQRQILALIPAYNEAAHITRVIEGTLLHLPVLVINDGSTDDTAARAEATGVEVLNQIPNQGKGAALKAGFARALEEGYQAVLTLDADGQHDPAEIPRFLEQYSKEPADLIIGARNFAQMPLRRRLANLFGLYSFSWAIGQRIRDNQSGYRLISRRLMQAMISSTEQGYQFEVEMIVIAVKRGFSIAWVPISTIYADEKSHIKPWRHVFEFLSMILRTRRMMRSKNLQDPS
ncbi:MAG: glycosyltransferase family 2 protein [Chloroflexi bacterium]|jgi:glycosyltransferase involved in cell wall biosynthesis|nr:glycosyltransferase family 2 protein [Chloroflexota bacterium]